MILKLPKVISLLDPQDEDFDDQTMIADWLINQDTLAKWYQSVRDNSHEANRS